MITTVHVLTLAAGLAGLAVCVRGALRRDGLGAFAGASLAATAALWWLTWPFVWEAKRHGACAGGDCDFLVAFVTPFLSGAVGALLASCAALAIRRRRR